MILKELYVISLKEKEIIRKYVFNTSGLNIILGVAKKDSNGVGKTAMVDAIRMLLGAKMPEDFQHKEELAQRDILLVLKIEVNGKVLYLARQIIDDENGYISENVALDLKGWNMYDLESYRIKVQDYVFGNLNYEEAPSLQTIREYLIRDEKQGFSDITLSKRKAIKNSQCLDFLSLLPIYYETEINKLKNEQASLQTEIKIIKTLAKDITKLKSDKIKLESEINRMKNMLDSVNVSDKIDYDEEKYILAKKELKKVEERTDMILSEKQKEAIRTINDNNVTIITGGPGTGKTTIIKSIIEIYKQKKYKIVLCAPTGRAAKRMTETTGEEAQTLHRLLEIGKVDDDVFYKKDEDFEGAPIDADIIIVDEMSMVDMFVMSYLLDCIYLGTKLILVGDTDQLPSVGPGSVLKDIISSEKISTVHLDKIFRQAARSKIIVNAHRVNNGQKFIQKDDSELSENAKEDFFFIKENNQEKILEQVLSLCNGRLKKFGDYDFFENIQVLTPTKKGMLGTKELNKSLQQELNPPREGEPEKASMGVIFRIGDRIMQTKNNYDMYWERREGDSIETGNGVFNGEIGTITNINEKEKNIRIKFDDDKVCWYEFNDLEQIDHSYCITIHKAQGSEFDVVIMIVPQAAPMLLTRNLLYTGLTRAKKLLIVIGNDRVVDFMINNVDSKKRNTGLEYKLKNT